MSYNKNYCILKERYLLSQKGSSKQTFHIVLQIDRKKNPYKEGDSIAIFPKNPAFLVEKTANSLQTTQEMICPTTLYNFLEREVNICKAPQRLLSFLAQKTIDPQKKEELHTYIASKNLWKNLTSSFHLWEIFERFPIECTFDELKKAVSPLLPRFYSIASSPSLFKDEIHLLVVEKTYELQGIFHRGIGSNYLCKEAEIGEKILMYIQPSKHFILPEDNNRAIIMIGAGTGLAPFRSFLQTRSLNKAEKNWVIFGEREKKYDFYYQEFLEDLVGKGELILDTAFSRDQDKKIYVQHILLQKQKKLWEWIQNKAIIYVCGDAKNMAKAIEKALLETIQNQGGKNPSEAIQFLHTLRKEKNYLCDVY